MPADWQHPKELRMVWGQNRELPYYIPMYDQTLVEAQAEWDREKEEWPNSDTSKRTWGEDHDWDDGTSVKADDLIWKSYEDYASSRPTELIEYDPDMDDDWNRHYVGIYAAYRHRSWTPEEATHFQVYETVSEGTPVSPVLASLEEVKQWCIEQGYSEAAAQFFIENGSAFTFVSVDGSRELMEDIDSSQERVE